MCNISSAGAEVPGGRLGRVERLQVSEGSLHRARVDVVREVGRGAQAGDRWTLNFQIWIFYLLYIFLGYLLNSKCWIFFFTMQVVRTRIFFSGRQRMKSSMQHKRELLAHREECLTANSCPELQVPPSSFDVTPCVDGEHLSWGLYAFNMLQINYLTPDVVFKDLLVLTRVETWTCWHLLTLKIWGSLST